MQTFASKLSGNMFGNHRRRTKEGRKDADDSEMREILSDWYSEELYEFERGVAVQKLGNVFRDSSIGLNSFAFVKPHKKYKKTKKNNQEPNI